jgi:hypothetical protein
MHRPLRSGLFARLLAAVFLLAAFTVPALADTVYVVSQTTGGLFRFDVANPADTITVISAPGTFNTPTALALGPDGHLYVGESGDDPEFEPRISRVIVTGSTATISTVVTLTGTDTAIYGEGGTLAPAAIAFRRPSDGGQMLVGRNPQAQSTGPVVKVSGWDTATPTVANFTTGTSLNSSPGLAVSASTGALYVSNSVYVQPAFSGTVVAFNGADDPAPFVAEVVPGTSGTISGFGPTGLAVFGSMLYSASTQNSSVYATNLTTGQTNLLGAIQPDFVTAFGFDVGALARLSNGDLLTGSVSGLNPSLYLVPAAGTGQLLAPFFTFQNFGSIGGIAVVPVPEPTALALAATAAVGLGWRCAGRRSRRA